MRITIFCCRSAVAVFWLQLLLISDVFIVSLAKRGGRIGTGRSGGRTNVGTGGSRSNTGVSHSSGGTGIGGRKSSSGGGWKTPALAGGVAGAVVGAAISHQLTKSYYKSTYGGRDYYYGDRYYHPTYSFAIKCVYQLPEDNYMRYDDGFTVKEIVFECDGRSENCCGMECCRTVHIPWWATVLMILAIVCLISCFVYTVMRYRRSRQDVRTRNAETSFPLQASSAATFGAAKSNPTSSGGYYPVGGGWQGQQPSAPPAYGFNVQPRQC